MTCARSAGCFRAPNHGGRCYIRRAGIVGPSNPYAEAMRRIRDERTHAEPPPDVSFHQAARVVADADLAYEVALHTGGPRAARVVLKERCVPARQAYRRALDAASKEAERS